jgi:4-hydroxymandelate oxidase
MNPINLIDYEDAAKQKLSPATYGYYKGGASDEITIQDNRRAYDEIKILPHVLRDVSQRDLSTTVLGQKIDFPVVIAPMAMAALAHPDKELAIANSAKKFGIPMCLSTLSTTKLEHVSATGVNSWFQLYVHKDRGMTRELVQRAEASGYQALVVTVDVPVAGYREYLVRNPLILPDNVQLETLIEYWNQDEYPSINAYVAAQFDPSVTWDDIEEFANQTTLPVLVKGILRADDAQEAVKRGVAGIVVSNHGGRQLDTVPATIDVLPEIAEAVDGRCELLVDGGIRRGTDIIKALALGAKAVMLGRPILWGLAVDGQAGVEDILTIIRREYDIALALSGCVSSESIPRDLVRLD